MIDLPLPCRFVQESQWKAVKKQENKWSMRAWKMWGIWIASEQVLLHNFSLSKACDSTILDSSQLHERPPKHTTVKIGRCALAWEECFPGTICYSRYVIQVWPGALLYYHYWLLSWSQQIASQGAVSCIIGPVVRLPEAQELQMVRHVNTLQLYYWKMSYRQV